jgi:hypothetical protein
MYQTVLEFFRAGGPTEGSIFQMAAADVHTDISITCIRYLILCATNTGISNFKVPISEANLSAIHYLYMGDLRSRPLPEVHRNAANFAGPGQEFWTSREFKGYARYLNGRLFLTYILGHLNDHLPKCRHAQDIQGLVSQLCERLINNPISYLLWNLDVMKSGDTRAESLVKHFLNNLIRFAVEMHFPRVVEVSLVAGADGGARFDGKTLLMVSVENGDQTTVRVLLD